MAPYKFASQSKFNNTNRPCGSQLFIGMSEPCKYGKSDVKQIDQQDRVSFVYTGVYRLL